MIGNISIIEMDETFVGGKNRNSLLDRETILTKKVIQLRVTFSYL